MLRYRGESNEFKNKNYVGFTNFERMFMVYKRKEGRKIEKP